MCQSLRAALVDRAVITHDLPPKRGVLAGEDTELLDAQDLLALTHPDASDLQLASFVRLLLGEPDAPGDALGRALCLARILSAVGEGVATESPRYLVASRALRTYCPESPWVSILGEAPLPPVTLDQPPYLSITAGEESAIAFDEEAIIAALRDEQRGRRHFPGYRVREEQVELARHFVHTLSEGRFALLEGGTGVGKSLAYLAAAIPYAVSGPGSVQRRPVVISTRTKLLQDQLIQKDIPAAARFLGIPDLRATSIKGRANYLCARRLRATLAEGGQPLVFEQDRLAYALLESAAALRPHGEVGALPRAFHQRYPLLGTLLREAVSARSEQCSREECALSPGCHFGERRKALAGAHLLVANHDLLLRWPTDYPSFGDVIVDEAHELPGVADEVYAVSVRPEEILERFDEVFGVKRGEAGLLTPSTRAAVEQEIAVWRGDLQQDLSAVGRSVAPLANAYGELEIPAEPDSAFDGAAEQADLLAQRLEFVAREIDRLRAGEEERGEKGTALKRAEEDLLLGASALRRVFTSGEESVASFSRVTAPYDHWKLSVRQVSLAELFEDGFLAQLDSFAGVSATLFVEGDPFAALGELALDAWAEERATRVAVPSPFPYAERMRVAAMRSRGQLVEEMTTVLTLLARRLGGRTLGLFTSLRRMQETAEALRHALRGEGIEVLVPRGAGDDPAALVERFRREERAVLLGSRTFWQGVDLPGEDLQAVAIEKLPFEVPTQLRKRREERLRAMGVNAFQRYTLGKMLLSLKQMTGRLIRSEEDRGVVVIVESRHDRGYFPQLNEAMPPGVQVTLTQSGELAALVDAVGIPRPAKPGEVFDE
jgi:Rad3-related DNA helicase